MKKNEITLSIEILESNDFRYYILKIIATKTKTGKQAYFKKVFHNRDEVLQAQDSINNNWLAFALNLFQVQNDTKKYDYDLQKEMK